MSQETAGRFTLLRKLPAGGMGRVFEAEDPAGPRRVALKLIDLGADPDSLQIVSAERLGAELQTRLCAIDKRITAIYETGEMPRYFYIVMEYVEGRDLLELYTAAGLDPMLAARITQDVLEVLDHAHNFSTTLDGRSIRGVVHGDLKPRNIRVTPTGEVKVLDFGIAKALSLTRNYTQNVFGSLQYSSPERLLTGEVEVGADLWAAGVMLYEMIAGYPYFQAENGPKLDHLIRGYDRVLPLPEAFPPTLRNILGRALHPDQRVRYQTAADFARDLQAFRNGQAVLSANDVEATRRVPQNDDATKRTTRPQPVGSTPPVDATRRTVQSPQQVAAAVDAGTSSTHAPPSAECNAHGAACDRRLLPRARSFRGLPGSERVFRLGQRSPTGAGPLQREAAESGCRVAPIPGAFVAVPPAHQLVGGSIRVAEAPRGRCRQNDREVPRSRWASSNGDRLDARPQRPFSCDRTRPG